MTNEEAEKILFYHRSTGNLSPMLNEALDLAISALSKQSASSEQADKKLLGHGYWLMPGEVFISHNALNKVLDTIIKSTNTEQRKIDSILAKTGQNDEAIRTDDYIADDGKMVDQFREDTKMTEDVPDIHVGKTDFQPGDKFILELGQERRMFGEFEIAGTDLYVETRLLEKLTRYDPEVKLDSAQPEIIYCKDCKYAEGVLGAIWCDKDGGYYNPMRHFCSEAERRNDEID
jgi:hypothetical protein